MRGTRKCSRTARSTPSLKRRMRGRSGMSASVRGGGSSRWLDAIRRRATWLMIVLLSAAWDTAPGADVPAPVSARNTLPTAGSGDPARAHAPKRAGLARGPPRMARAPAVAGQGDGVVQLRAGGRQPEHRVVQLVEPRALAEDPEPPADPGDVRVDRD